MKLGFKKVRPDAKIPTYAHPGDTGMDVYVPMNIVLDPNVPAIVPTGLIAEIPDGYELQVRPRSGLAADGVTVWNSPGSIDQNFRGEIGVILMATRGSQIPEAVEANKQSWKMFCKAHGAYMCRYFRASWIVRLFMQLFTRAPRPPEYVKSREDKYYISKGDRIAQLVLAPVTRCEPVEIAEVSDTERGEGGFGSTGR